jgi:hypothetical protein
LLFALVIDGLQIRSVTRTRIILIQIIAYFATPGKRVNIVAAGGGCRSAQRGAAAGVRRPELQNRTNPRA